MSTSFMILFAWLALSVVIAALGVVMGNNKLVTAGAVMLLMMAAVADVN